MCSHVPVLSLHTGNAPARHTGRHGHAPHIFSGGPRDPATWRLRGSRLPHPRTPRSRGAEPAAVSTAERCAPTPPKRPSATAPGASRRRPTWSSWPRLQRMARDPRSGGALTSLSSHRMCADAFDPSLLPVSVLSECHMQTATISVTLTRKRATPMPAEWARLCGGVPRHGERHRGSAQWHGREIQWPLP